MRRGLFSRGAALACLAFVIMASQPSIARSAMDRCAVAGWGAPLDGWPIAVRSRPSRTARIVGHFPVDADGRSVSQARRNNPRELAEFIVLERRGRWVRIGDARIVTLVDASWEVRQSDLAGWILADTVRFSVEYAHLHAAPSRSAVVLFSARDQILDEWAGWEDCKGNWVRIRLTADNMKALSDSSPGQAITRTGWVTLPCGSAMTGCDYPSTGPAPEPGSSRVPR